MRIGINGFGRIGRLIFREIFEREGMEVVAISNRSMSPDYMAYQLKYDTVHGRFNHTVDYNDKGLVVDGIEIPAFGASDPTQLPWGDLGVDYVVECTGHFTDVDQAQGHLTAGAKKVMISAPSKTAPMFVMGVNEESYDPATMHVVSNASCTTNCLAPVAKVLDDHFGIASGLMTTVHALTASQNTVDKRAAKDWRFGRAASGNIIPASTGAAKAVGKVIPKLDGKLTGMSFRVPVLDASVVDLTVNLLRPTSYEEICKVMKAESEGKLKGILGYTDEKVVSSDMIGQKYPSIFDADAGIGLTDTFFKVISWYDNEVGYSANVINMLEYMHRCESK